MKKIGILTCLICFILSSPHTSQGQNAKEFLGLAKQKFDSKDYFKALDFLDQSLNKDPEYAEAYFLKGLTEFNLQNTMGAIENFDQAIHFRANYLEAYFNRGLIKAGLQKYIEAVQDFDVVLKSKAIPVVFEQRGVAHYQLQHLDSAAQDFNKAIKLNPKLQKSLFYLGLIAYEQKEFDQSIQFLSDAIDKNADFEDAYALRVEVLLQKGDTTEALVDYGRLIQLNPYNYKAFMSRGKINFVLKNYQEALPDFTRLVTKQPENAEAFYYRALVYQKLNKAKEACKDWKEAKRLGYKPPDNELDEFCNH